MLERTFEAKFASRCEARGYHCLKLRIDGIDGFPDRTVLTPDCGLLFIEFKQPGRKLRPQQRLWRRMLTTLGFTYVVAHSCDEAERALDDYLNAR